MLSSTQRPSVELLVQARTAQCPTACASVVVTRSAFERRHHRTSFNRPRPASSTGLSFRCVSCRNGVWDSTTCACAQSALN